MTKYGSSGWSHWDNNYTIIIHLRIKDNHGPVLADVRRDWGYWGPGSVRLLQSCLSAKYPNKWFFFSILIRNQKYPLRMLRVISVPRYNLADWRLSVSVWYIWRWTVSRCQTESVVLWSMARRPAWLPAGPKVVVSSRAVLIWPALWFFIGASSSVGPCLGMGRLNEALLYISQSYIHSLHSPSQHQ